MIHEPKLLADAAAKLTKVADLAVHGSIPRPIQDFMVEVPILAALRATYGCGNARAIACLAWRRIARAIHGALFPILHPIEARRIKAEIRAEMDGLR